jgi:hypothetical protein
MTLGSVLGGFILGLVVGRWWALAAAAALGAWIAVNTPVEIPTWILGAGSATLAAVGIAAGVAGRRWVRSRS